MSKKAYIRKEDEKQKAAIAASELPDFAIHQVFQFLCPRDVVRASIVSKQWEREWHSVPVLDLDEEKHVGDYLHDIHHQNFIDYATWSLKCRLKDKSPLNKFKLRTIRHVDCHLVDGWLSLALERNPKELYVSTGKYLNCSGLSAPDNGYYCLSHKVLDAKFLTVLDLQHVRIDSHESIRLPSLKSLSLKKCYLRYFHLLSGCPSIEDLSINSCYGLSDVKVSSSTLKSLEVIMCFAMYDVKVEAMNLESFRLGGNQYNYRLTCNKVDFSSCGALRNLDIIFAELEEQWFEDFDSRYPAVERLILLKCRVLGHINLRSQHLRRFVFENHGYDSILRGRIDTPNLNYLGFWGTVTWPNTEVHIKAPNLSEATIVLHDTCTTPMLPFQKSCCIRNFLANFDNCGTLLTLCACDTKALIFPENMRRECSPPLTSLKHLKVITDIEEVFRYPRTNTIVKIADLMDSLRWMAPSLEFLSTKTKTSDGIFYELRRAVDEVLGQRIFRFH
ncbi:hypothetical protein ACFX19_031553 [Malus domestica]